MISNPCALEREWGIAAELGRKLVRMQDLFQQDTGLDLRVISGMRTCEKQRELDRRSRPTAPCELSTHTTCPATGADLKIMGAFPSLQVKQQFGNAAVTAGLRWGGGSERSERGIPLDWNHVDLGPRTDRIAQAFRAGLRA